MNEKMMKSQSSIANDVIHRCSQVLNASVGKLSEEFAAEWKPETGDYSRKLVEYCCSKALISEECSYIQEKICDGSFSRLTFDMMLAWEMPSSQDEQSRMECVGKGREEKTIAAEVPEGQDDIPLFYSDLMPLLVNEEPSVGEDAFVWLASLVPLVADIVNGRFTFESLTAATGCRLFFPGYDKFLKEIDRCIKNLQKQAKPKDVELADDEFILHVDGTATSQRVVRHIGASSLPGRLTLTNYALYYEATGLMTYNAALKIDLSKNVKHEVKPVATGPWGAPLFDKAIIYESPEIPEGIVLEFPELTSSTRRDHWLALIKEIILMHQFLSKHKMESPSEVYDVHARTIFGIARLHAARELLRISPPPPKSFLIFALFDELPKGDFVLEELAKSLKKSDSGHSCSASSILRSMCVSRQVFPSVEVKELDKECKIVTAQDENQSLDTAINQTRVEAKETGIAKATTEVLKEEGISKSATVLMELLKPLKSFVPLFKEVMSWEKPATTWTVLVASLVIVYKEWVGKAISTCLLWAVFAMLRARLDRKQDESNDVVVCTSTEQKITIESIVSAQLGLKNAHEMVQEANIAILKIRSIVNGKAPKHADTVMLAMIALAIILAVIPTRHILMALISYSFFMSSSLGNYMENERGNRRMKEWWDSIPIMQVRVIEGSQSSS